MSRVKHWDVNNENIHGDWYEQTTGDPNITMKMFHDAHAVDPNVKLFLNDFGVMESYAAVVNTNLYLIIRSIHHYLAKYFM
jgi:GH35 family endo-1,4-beta-xylanase